ARQTVATAQAAPPAKHSAPAKKAGAVSADAKHFTQLVMQALLQVDTLAAANAPEAARLRKAIVDAAKQGQEAKGREAAKKALGLATMEIGMLQVTATARAATAKAKADAGKAKPKERLY